MDKLDQELIKKIEQALGLGLHEWQVNYILDIPMVLNMNITRRRTGKTLAYILKLLFNDDKPILAYDINFISGIADSYHVMNHINPHYELWFRNYLLEIYEQLIGAGIKTRPVLFSEPDKIIERRRFLL